MAGVEWLVPDEAVYHSCPAGKKSAPPGPAHTPPAAKHARPSPVPLTGPTLVSCALPPETCVPGAIRSGFLRWSPVGPRLENGMMSRALFAWASVVPHPSAPPNGLTFSEAPAVRTFFATPGLPTVFAPIPSLPAAKITVYSWLPTAFGRASRTIPSKVCALTPYELTPLPQLLELMRAPSKYACSSRVTRFGL